MAISTTIIFQMIPILFGVRARSNEYSRHDSKQAAMDKLNGIFETNQDPEIRDAVMLAMNKLNK